MVYGMLHVVSVIIAWPRMSCGGCQRVQKVALCYELFGSQARIKISFLSLVTESENMFDDRSVLTE